MTSKVFPALYLLREIEATYEIVSTSDLSRNWSYVRLGVAKDVEFTIDGDDEQLESAITALEKAKQKEMADSQVRLNKLDEQIQNLLAITHSSN